MIRPIRSMTEDFAKFYGWDVEPEFDKLSIHDYNYLDAVDSLQEKVENFIMQKFMEEKLFKVLGFEFGWFPQ